MVKLPGQYHDYEQRFLKALGLCRASLSKEALVDVEHWLDAGEIEMAFESLCLSLRGEQIDAPGDAKAALLELGPALGLDRESVFEAEFWEKTLPYLKANTVP